MSAKPLLSPRAPAGLQAEIRVLVNELRRLRTGREVLGIYRRLVLRGLEAGEAAEDYRRRLLQAGLKPSRASELSRILGDRPVARRFTAKRPVSYRVALRAVRGRRAVPVPKPGARLARLQKLGAELVRQCQPGSEWALNCGLFRLRWVPRGEAGVSPRPHLIDEQATALGFGQAADVSLVLLLAPETERRLTRLARQSGINNAETAARLLARAPLSEVLAQWGSENPATPSTGEFLLQRRNPPAKSELQRRKNPRRSSADTCRLPVVLPATLVDQLTALANGHGLSRAELASLWLEPDPRGRLAAIRSALQAARRQRQQELDPDGARTIP